jgi:hypothetical protein
MGSYDQNSTVHRGSHSPVQSLANVTSIEAPQYSCNQPGSTHHDSRITTGVPKEDPVLRALSTDPAAEDTHGPPIPPKDEPYQRTALIQQTRIEDYKLPSVILVDGEGKVTATQDQPARESLSSEPESSNGETRRPRTASSADFGTPRPPARSSSTPTLRRRRTSRERDDGGCRLASPPPGLRESRISRACQLLTPGTMPVRPTTFWKNIPRSAVAAPDFSPVIRRSTFIAAGIQVDRPLSGLSALGVETRGPPTPVILPPELI